MGATIEHKEAGYLTYRGKKSSPGGLIASVALIITNNVHRFKSFMRCFITNRFAFSICLKSLPELQAVRTPHR